VDVQQAVLSGIGGERDFGKIDGSERRSVVAVLEQLAGDFESDIVLGFLRAAADVG
jgi:hypothetical protein